MPQLDFFYFIGSTYTYLSVMRIDEVARRAGVTVNWRPFNGRGVMTEHPFHGKPVKCAYMWRDVERRATRLGIGWNGVPPYPIERPNLPNRIAVAAAREGWAPEYSKAAYRAWFSAHKNLEDEKALSEVLASIGKDPAAVIALANSEDIRQLFASETEAARMLGIFGAPTFAVGKEIFWGDDRMEEAIEWATRETQEKSQ
ncbi:MAG TPA: 2-hydroxychromene-2-carboxylate isomerase [Noviherbaspirillum sp.]|uniref:2-hydroxychromene-2-carboxylate isomerase n=1 Tax=Noviherbaspirillum sp. TaxID=1926288 RepID=UPI002D58FB33|nr:2-hydroxychromene-2-carboxylate isomerase [Noviherbaspirillum sp.]HYD94484.1 2-hydroxychromene-2-carboxylate isomerase [Noviherbaspirillum sp.]